MLYLGFAIDACKLSITTGHQLDEASVREYPNNQTFMSIMLDSETPENRATMAATYMEGVVLGVSYICPADHEQWRTIVDQIGNTW